MIQDSHQIREELNKVIEKIRAVLAEDLPLYPVRTGKKRYIAGPEFAASLTAEQLSNLKKELRDDGEKVAHEILEALKNEDIWLKNLTPSGDGPAKILRDNSAVSRELSKIADFTKSVLESYGYPSDQLKLHYDTPTWFIKGEYLPGLIEKYWKNIRNYMRSEREHKRAQVEQDVQLLAERWEEA